MKALRLLILGFVIGILVSIVGKVFSDLSFFQHILISVLIGLVVGTIYILIELRVSKSSS
ncbi:hypothetical protein SAMN05216362_1078 [Piscibacillus halophilus]|uniref:Uncharacterized protein n=1 Tax=Piscibacillus halophilus TaxID=571933 RepID=A0A1H9DG45_9BACI|nr:hypothetical protein SAMN05216362_1078 [Piscibacillus halophilus]